MDTTIILSEEQIIALEQQHNVYIDRGSMQYNLNGYSETYGWQAIPQAWIEK